MSWHRKKFAGKLIIKAKDIHVSEGHKPHHTGTGVHASKPRKNRTRRDEHKNAIKDSQSGLTN